MVWLSARRDFAFQGTSYRAGEVFRVAPIVAVQMRALCAVSWAKAPAAEPAKTPAAPRRSGRRAAPKASAPVIDTSAESVVPAPADPATDAAPTDVPAAPAEPMTTDSPLVHGTYRRQDLRAED